MDRIEVLMRELRLFRDEREWQAFHNPKDLAIAVSIEAAELLELFRWKNPNEVSQLLASDEFEHVKEEAADILIFLLNFAQVCGFDLVGEAFKKLEKNRLRYPASVFRGSNRKYNSR